MNSSKKIVSFCIFSIFIIFNTSCNQSYEIKQSISFSTPESSDIEKITFACSLIDSIYSIKNYPMLAFIISNEGLNTLSLIPQDKDSVLFLIDNSLKNIDTNFDNISIYPGTFRFLKDKNIMNNGYCIFKIVGINNSPTKNLRYYTLERTQI